MNEHIFIYSYPLIQLVLVPYQAYSAYIISKTADINLFKYSLNKFITMSMFSAYFAGLMIYYHVSAVHNFVVISNIISALIYLLTFIKIIKEYGFIRVLAESGYPDDVRRSIHTVIAPCAYISKWILSGWKQGYQTQKAWLEVAIVQCWIIFDNLYTKL